MIFNNPVSQFGSVPNDNPDIYDDNPSYERRVVGVNDVGYQVDNSDVCNYFKQPAQNMPVNLNPVLRAPLMNEGFNGPSGGYQNLPGPAYDARSYYSQPIDYGPGYGPYDCAGPKIVY